LKYVDGSGVSEIAFEKRSSGSGVTRSIIRSFLTSPWDRLRC